MKRPLLLSVLAGVLLLAMAVPALAAPMVWNFDSEYSTTEPTSFDSGYNWVPSTNENHSSTGYPGSALWLEGSYTIGDDPGDYHIYWTHGPHTAFGGTGYMLIANGSVSTGIDVWSATVPVIPNHAYTFSAQVASSYPVAPPTLSFKMDGTPLAVQTAVLAGWNSLGGSTVISEGVTSVTFSIGNSELAASGNDYAIDNITIAEVGTTVGKATGGIKFMAGTTEVQLDFVAMSTATGAKGNVLCKNSLGLSFMGKVTSYWQNADGTVAALAGTITKGDYTEEAFWIAVGDNGEGINAEDPDYGVRVVVGAGPIYCLRSYPACGWFQ